VSRPLGLDPDHADVPVTGRQRGRDPGDQPATADRDEDGVEAGGLLGQFEADGPLSGDHVGVVEGVDERQSSLLGEFQRVLVGPLVDLPLDDDVGAVPPRRVDLRGGRHLRDDHCRVDPEEPSGERDALRVVTRARGHDAAFADLGGEPRHRVVRAADLERPRPLGVLQFETDRDRVRPLGDGRRSVERGAMDDALQPVPRRLDVGDGDHLVGGRDAAARSPIRPI